MLEQLFSFYTSESRVFLLIGASSRTEAEAMLARFLEARPTMPPPKTWKLSSILSKLDHGIFSFSRLE